MFKRIILVLALLTIGGPLEITDNKNGDSPVISNLEVSPSSGHVGTVYTISLRIADPQGPDDIIEILYHVREKRELIEVLINDDGLNGDLLKGDGIYTGRDIVPETAARQTHFFEVFVMDRETHRSNILKYRFTVLDINRDLIDLS